MRRSHRHRLNGARPCEFHQLNPSQCIFVSNTCHIVDGNRAGRVDIPAHDYSIFLIYWCYGDSLRFTTYR